LLFDFLFFVSEHFFFLLDDLGDCVEDGDAGEVFHWTCFVDHVFEVTVTILFKVKIFQIQKVRFWFWELSIFKHLILNIVVFFILGFFLFWLAVLVVAVALLVRAEVEEIILTRHLLIF
jgi:hypothetical protein